MRTIDLIPTSIDPMAASVWWRFVCADPKIDEIGCLPVSLFGAVPSLAFTGPGIDGVKVEVKA